MKVAVLGCGTIGKGVVDIILNGIKDIELKRILDKREKFLPELIDYYTDNFDDILDDDEIEAVVETMGGRGFSYSCVKSALQKGKSVVTANKELIAYHLDELNEIASANGVYLLFEASVGGGIPFMKTLSNLSEFNKTASILGILNGTTNYILTKMQKDKLGYDEALKGAQKLGFAEANPTADVEGHDLVRKIAILSMLAYKQKVNPDDIYTFGISGVTKEFIDYISSLGYVLKFVCFAKMGDKLEIGVEPILVEADSVIGNINYENNIVSFDMKPNDKITFIGKGAGRMPTATAVVSDLKVIRDKGQKMNYIAQKGVEVGFMSEEVDAVVLKDGKIELKNSVQAETIRNGEFDFYAIIYRD